MVRGVNSVLLVLGGLLVSTTSRAVEIYTLYGDKCQSTTGAIINADDERVSVLTLTGETKSLAVGGVQMVARYDVLENPFPHITSSKEGPEILNVTSESSEGSFRAFASDFFENLVLFLDDQGKIRVVEMDEIVSITGDGEHKGSVVPAGTLSYRTVKLVSPPGRETCPPVLSPELRGKAPVDRVATQVMADKLRIDSFWERLRTGYRDLESLRERTLFYARPIMFDQKTRLGLIAERGNRADKYPVSERMEDFPLYLEFGSGQAYRFQGSTSIGRKSWRMVPDVKPITAARSEFKSHLLHGIFIANLSGFTAGKPLFTDSWAANPDRKAVWLESSFNHLTLLGGDYGPWTVSYGYFFPTFALGKGAEFREVTSPKLSPVFHFGFQLTRWQVEAFVYHTDLSGDVMKIADADSADETGGSKFVRYYSTTFVPKSTKLQSNAARVDLSLLLTDTLHGIADLSYRQTKFSEVAFKRDKPLADAGRSNNFGRRGRNGDTTTTVPDEPPPEAAPTGSDARNHLAQTWFGSRLGVRMDLGQWVALGAEVSLERAETKGEFSGASGASSRTDDIHDYVIMMELLL